MFDPITKEVLQKYFVNEGYLIPTDNIRQQSDEILFNYIEKMRNKNDISTIYVYDPSGERCVGETISVSELADSHKEIYVIDGHHRYLAWLAVPEYPLNAVFVDSKGFSPRQISDYYDFLDAYEWAVNTLRQK